MKGGICVYCDSGNVFIKSNVQGGARAEKNVIKDSIFVRSNVDLSTTINLYVDDEAAQGEFFQELMGQFNIQPLFDESQQRNVWKIPVSTPDIGELTLTNLKEGLRKEIQLLKMGQRKLLVKARANETKRKLLEGKVEKLKLENPTSRELPRLEGTVWALAQYEVKAGELQEKIDELTDQLHAVVAMREEERFLRDLEEACGAVEVLLGDAVRVIGEAEKILGEME